MPPQFENNIPLVSENTEPKKIQKKWVGYIFMILAIIFIGLVIYIVWGVYKFDKSLKGSDSPGNINSIVASPNDQFADWKTYKNEEYGFEFKYPAEFNFDENGIQIGQINTLRDYPINPERGGFDIPFGCAIDFSIEANQKFLPLTDWIPKFTSIKGLDTEITVDNQKGIQRTYGDDVTQDTAVAIFIPKQDKVYFYSAQEASCISKLNKILSTFKFIATSTPK